MDEDEPWKPNSISVSERVFNLVLAIALLVQGVIGFYFAEVRLTPPKQKAAILFREGPAWLMAAAMVVGALVLISVVIDHYDRRQNEHAYKSFRWLCVRLGLCLLAASLIAHLYVSLTR
jgi:uncharacterized membrane protein